MSATRAVFFYDGQVLFPCVCQLFSDMGIRSGNFRGVGCDGRSSL